MTDLVGHFFFFAIIIIGALLGPLLIGKLVRPKLPTPEKDAIYECGEPTIGTSNVQFDLRYYVVALVFIVFDVEVIFFFPWAMIFGGATPLADSRLTEEARTELSAKMLNMPASEVADSGNIIAQDTAYTLMGVSWLDVLVFFGVLLVGFAYVWKRGDIDWVRTVMSERTQSAVTPPHEISQHASRPETQTVG
jgi:NADH-quinone oxidoreductase subunit A